MKNYFLQLVACLFLLVSNQSQGIEADSPYNEDDAILNCEFIDSKSFYLAKGKTSIKPNFVRGGQNLRINIKNRELVRLGYKGQVRKSRIVKIDEQNFILRVKDAYDNMDYHYIGLMSFSEDLSKLLIVYNGSNIFHYLCE